MTRSLRAVTMTFGLGLVLAGVPALAVADHRDDDGRRDDPRDHRDDDGRRDDTRDHRDDDTRDQRWYGDGGWRGDVQVRDRRSYDRYNRYDRRDDRDDRARRGWHRRPVRGHWERVDGDDFGRLGAMAQACEDAFVGDANEQACLQLARSARVDLTFAIPACERAFVGDASALSCLQVMASGSVQTGAIDACETAFIGDASALQCMSLTAGSRYDAGQLVSYCESSTWGDAAALQCLASFRGR
jgi:hypothetical protein